MRITKIRTKFLVILLPLFILSFIILSGISYYLASGYLTKGAAETAAAMGEKFALKAHSQISEKMIHVEDIAATANMRSLNETAIVSRLGEESKRRSGYTTLFFINLKDPAFNYGITAEGRKFDYTTRSYTEHILKDKKSYVSDPNVSSTTGKLSVMLVTPVNNQGVMDGFVGATVSLDSLSELMGEVQFEQSGYGYIVDNSGLVIGHKKSPELVGKANVKEMPIGEGFQRVVSSGKQERVHYTNADGEAFTAILTPIDLQDTRWVMAVTAPDSEIHAEASELAKTMTTISFLSLLIVSVIIALFCQKIAKPLQVIRDECDILNSGDLRKREIAVTAHDETGQLAQGFIKMRNTLASLINKLQGQAEQVAASSQELTAGAQQSSEASEHVAAAITRIAEGADQQSLATRDSATAAKEMSVNAGKISERVQDVSNIAKSASCEVENGRNEIATVVTQMNKIEAGSGNVEKSIVALAECSKEISSIVELISSIAGQTNLLALNAAIEAARAGEQGKGFAVVAEEVRKLAEESNQASQRIAALVGRNQKDMDEAILATKSSSDGVRLGMSAVTSADEKFKNIVNAITKLSQEISGISGAINEMVAGYSTLLQRIQDIDNVSKQNVANSQSVSAATEQQAASMREVADASQGLAILASELQSEVAKFKV